MGSPRKFRASAVRSPLSRLIDRSPAYAPSSGAYRATDPPIRTYALPFDAHRANSTPIRPRSGSRERRPHAPEAPQAPRTYSKQAIVPAHAVSKAARTAGAGGAEDRSEPSDTRRSPTPNKPPGRPTPSVRPRGRRPQRTLDWTPPKILSLSGRRDSSRLTLEPLYLQRATGTRHAVNKAARTGGANGAGGPERTLDCTPCQTDS